MAIINRKTSSISYLHVRSKIASFVKVRYFWHTDVLRVRKSPGEKNSKKKRVNKMNEGGAAELTFRQEKKKKN